ncbi:MAG: NADH-quinone oxidoreductase subunit C [Elusimicrobiota bacterium]|nr:MAG: NADH-quinone oxidoreductase subunit C [Elusimicrobiota bacterium]
MSDLLRGDIREIPAASNVEELAKLKAEGFNVLVDMTAIDRLKLGKLPRFEVVYRFMKLDAATGEDRGRAEARCAVDEQPVLRSAKGLWPNADWLEREVWDMFGVKFADRPDIKRLLMYEEFSGHALRKDYPIAKRQPLIGPKSGDKAGSPSFNILKPTVTGE